jgi:molybdopterin adenylyltransferase
MGVKDHREHSETIPGAKCAVFTVSDTRTPETDESGKLALEILMKFGHTVIEQRIVPNDRRQIDHAIGGALKNDADVVVTLGGTGVSKRDVSIEAARGHIDRELPGFGELFRSMSAAEIGTAAILSRALLGVTDKGRVVVCVPGSPAAGRLALERILMNELKHLLGELRK